MEKKVRVVLGTKVRIVLDKNRYGCFWKVKVLVEKVRIVLGGGGRKLEFVWKKS